MNLSTLLSRCCHNCLWRKRNRRLKLLLRSPRVNVRKGRAHPLRTLRMKSILTLNYPSSSEEEDNSENGSTYSKRMSKLEQCLEALANRDRLQEVGIPYAAECDTAPYPTKFKVLTLHTFNDKGRRTNTYTTSNPKLGM